jgi:murein DD-endopeptidase MepM/ murein hydrolase activator NlpD
MTSLHVKRLSVAFLLATGLLAGGGQALASRPGAPRWQPYHWPVKPFDIQHPVQAAFGDPRTLYRVQPFGRTGPKQKGAYSFHNGVDISAPAGTPVYPVVSGRVLKAIPNEIVVGTYDGRTFQYYHLDSLVHTGQAVTAQRTIIGTVKAKALHVHLAEIDRTVVHNPLATGHLTPYQDWTKPVATNVYIDNGAGGPRPLVADHVAAHDRLVIAANDAPAQPLSGDYAGLPQVPALVEWRLFHAGTHTAWTAAADFRSTEPPGFKFWHTFGPGTYQNLPVFEHRCFMATPGRYLFNVSLDASRLSPGAYRIQVRVADIRQNSSVSSWPLQIGKAAVPQ